MNTVNTNIDFHARARTAHACALAIVTACILALAVVIAAPFAREEAHAAATTTVEYRIFEPKESAGTPLLPIFVPQLPNYPGNLIAGESEYVLAPVANDGGLEDVSLDPETGEVSLKTSGRNPGTLDILEIAVFPKGSKDADSPTILVRLYIDLQSEWLVSDGLTFDLVPPGTYDANPHPGYVGTAQIAALDRITGQTEAGTGSYSGQDGWVYLYRGVNGTVFDGPTYQLARDDAELANLKRPTAAGDYELTIARPNAIPYVYDPYVSFNPGWKTIQFTIDPCTITTTGIIESDPSATKVYDGTPTFHNVALGLVGVPAAETEPPTASGNAASANVGTHAIDPDSVTLSGRTAGSYILDNDVSGNVTIVKAPAFNLADQASLHDEAGYQKTVQLSQVQGLPADRGGQLAYSIESFTTNGLADASVDLGTGELTLTAKGAADGKTDTVTVKLSGMGNYEDSTVEVAVSYVARADAVVSGVAAAAGLVYNGLPQAGYTGTPAATCTPYPDVETEDYPGPFAITYTGTVADGTAYGPTNQAPSAAGAYRVTFEVPAGAFYPGSLTLDFAIEKAPLVFRAKDATMTAGDPAPKLGYKAVGLQGSDRVTQEPLLTVEGDTKAAGFCTIAISGGVVDNQASYEAAYENSMLTVNAAPAKHDPAPTPKALAATGDAARPELPAAAAAAALVFAAVAAAARIRTRHHRR